MQAFYSIQRLGNEVSATSPIPIELADVYSRIFPFVKEDKEYFGLIDTNGTTLQAMYYCEEDLYWFEVPRPDLEGSYGCYLNFDQAADLIKTLENTFPQKGFEGFEFNSWK
ncbi:hypothetical protein NBRC116583_39200 [Arenicella sp. 4NH20-0111]|uniref:hypothetical protein n=1 Tax=Arenicella sp. 4NH20-0111 TaxID=3127648 RepID=UPI00310462FB